MQSGPNIEKQERTKRKLQDALMTLYKKSSIEKITVRQVVELAGVTRSTFYAYYDSVYSALEAIEDELQSGLGPYFEQYSGGILEKAALKPFDSNVKWFDYCRAHREYLLILLGPNGDPSFTYKLRKRLKVDINRMMDEDGMLNDNLRKYVVEYVTGATLSLMYYWLENDDNLSAGDIAVVANLIRQSKIVIEGMRKNPRV